eukprot:9132633-Alexandrium_andersonii.AAC.1
MSASWRSGARRAGVLQRRPSTGPDRCRSTLASFGAKPPRPPCVAPFHLGRAGTMAASWVAGNWPQLSGSLRPERFRRERGPGGGWRQRGTR